MELPSSLRLLLDYSDAMNRKVFDAAGNLSAAQLDQSFDMGMGTLRKTLAHIQIGEAVWLERWKGNVETPWPKADPSHTPADLLRALEAVWTDRDTFLTSLSATQLASRQSYRDSKGSLFHATLEEMVLQGIVHSTHHRAQAVNMIRRASSKIVEVDFMYWRRQPTA